MENLNILCKAIMSEDYLVISNNVQRLKAQLIAEQEGISD